MNKGLVQTIFCSLRLACLFGFICFPAATPAEIRIDATDRGWFDETGFNELDNVNYFVGDGRGPIGGSASPAAARNFFVFDLSSVGETIESATLSLYVPPVTGYFSADLFETYVLSELTFDANYVMTVSDDIGVYDDLGDGQVFGTRDFGNFDVDVQIEIPLNAAAVAALNDQRQSFDPLFVIGGSITTLNQFPDDEMIFAFSFEVPFDQTQLIINPEGPIDADFNDDSVFDCLDANALTQAIVDGDLAFDLTGDGMVDSDDLSQWLVDAGAANLPSGNSYLVGDANLDGSVDVSDFNLWNGSKFTNTAAYCHGDFNVDGTVDVSDFNLWNMNKLRSSEVLSVPEPDGNLTFLVFSLGIAARFWLGMRELRNFDD